MRSSSAILPTEARNEMLYHSSSSLDPELQAFGGEGVREAERSYSIPRGEASLPQRREESVRAGAEDAAQADQKIRL